MFVLFLTFCFCLWFCFIFFLCLFYAHLFVCLFGAFLSGFKLRMLNEQKLNVSREVVWSCVILTLFVRMTGTDFADTGEGGGGGGRRRKIPCTRNMSYENCWCLQKKATLDDDDTSTGWWWNHHWLIMKLSMLDETITGWWWNSLIDDETITGWWWNHHWLMMKLSMVDNETITGCRWSCQWLVRVSCSQAVYTARAIDECGMNVLMACSDVR